MSRGQYQVGDYTPTPDAVQVRQYGTPGRSTTHQLERVSLGQRHRVTVWFVDDGKRCQTKTDSSLLQLSEQPQDVRPPRSGGSPLGLGGTATALQIVATPPPKFSRTLDTLWSTASQKITKFDATRF